MNEKGNRPGILGPMILIAIGVVLLLNQMGRLPGDFWWTLWRYWPVVLILAGIEVLMGISRSRLVYFLGVLLALVVIAGLVGYAILRGDSAVGVQSSGATETISHPLQDAERALVNLRLVAGSIELTAASDSPNLVEGRVQYSKRSNQVDDRFEVRNGRAEWMMRSNQGSKLVVSGGDWNDLWQLKLNRRVPLSLNVEMAAGSVDADLRGLKVTDAQVDVVAGTATIRVPESAGTTRVTVKIAVGEINIIIPAGTAIRVRPSKLLGSFEVPGHRLTQSGSYWITDDYESATSRVDIVAETVLGSINLR